MKHLVALFIVGASLLLAWQYTVNWYTIQGLISYTLGDAESASGSFRQAIDKNPRNIYAHYYLGQLNYERGRYQAAISELRTVVRLVPVHHAAHMLLADSYAANSEFDQALQSARQALRLQSGNANYHFHLGLIYKESGRYLDAISSFDQAIALGVEDRDILFNRAFAYFSLGEFEQAADHFKRVLNRYPVDYESHLLLARCLHELHQSEASIREYQQAAVLDDNDFFVHFELASLYQEENKLDAAYQSLRRALGLNPDHAELAGSLFSLAMAFKDQHQFDKARGLIAEAIGLDPVDAEYHYQLGLLYKENNEYSFAVNSLTKAKQLGFTGGDLQYSLAYSLINLGEDEAALEALLELLDISPDHEYAHADLARIYHRRDDIKSAIGEFEVDLKLTPEDFFSHYDLGLLYREQGNLERARKHLEIAWKLNPEYPYTCEALMAVYGMLGDETRSPPIQSCVEISG